MPGADANDLYVPTHDASQPNRNRKGLVETASTQYHGYRLKHPMKGQPSDDHCGEARWTES